MNPSRLKPCIQTYGISHSHKCLKRITGERDDAYRMEWILNMIMNYTTNLGSDYLNELQLLLCLHRACHYQMSGSRHTIDAPLISWSSGSKYHGLAEEDL